MKLLTCRNANWIARKNGWSLAYAQGHIDGEIRRHDGRAPTAYMLVGIDDYALGFRAGYFECKAISQPTSPESALAKGDPSGFDQSDAGNDPGPCDTDQQAA